MLDREGELCGGGLGGRDEFHRMLWKMPMAIYDMGDPRETQMWPEMLLETPTFDAWYEKAFLTLQAEPDREFDRNTSTWD